MAYKVFVAGEEALAADANSYLMSQAVARFTNATQRTSQLTAPVLNQLSMRDDRPGIPEFWNGSAWTGAGQGAELAYGQTSAGVNVSNTSASTGHQVVDLGNLTFEGFPVWAEFGAANVVSPTAGYVFLGLYDGGANMFAILGAVASNASAVSAPVIARFKFTPTAGTHNFKVGAWLSPGSTGVGTVQASGGSGGSYSPAFLRITRA